MMERILARFRKPAVYFDVDSTLVRLEGLDALGRRKAMGDQIASLTKLAMEGKLPNDQVMAEKMKLLSPSRREMAGLASEYLSSMVEDVPAVISALRKGGVRVGIITGNFHPAVDPLARALGIKRRDVHANPMYFDRKGGYAGYDPNHPLINKGGKAVVAEKLRPKHSRMIMVGDAKTDLETKPVVDLFIGFGGVERRPIVEEQADVFVLSESIAPVLLYALPERALRRMRNSPILQKAREEDKKTLKK